MLSVEARRRPESNRRIKVLQTSALPLGYAARDAEWSGKRDSNPRPTAWEAVALPTELFPLRAQHF